MTWENQASSQRTVTPAAAVSPQLPSVRGRPRARTAPCRRWALGTGAGHSWRQAIFPGRPFHWNKDNVGKNDTCDGFSPGCRSVASGNTIPTHERWVLAVQCPIHNCWCSSKKTRKEFGIRHPGLLTSACQLYIKKTLKLLKIFNIKFWIQTIELLKFYFGQWSITVSWLLWGNKYKLHRKSNFSVSHTFISSCQKRHDKV